MKCSRKSPHIHSSLFFILLVQREKGVAMRNGHREVAKKRPIHTHSPLGNPWPPSYKTKHTSTCVQTWLLPSTSVSTQMHRSFFFIFYFMSPSPTLLLRFLSKQVHSLLPFSFARITIKSTFFSFFFLHKWTVWGLLLINYSWNLVMIYNCSC
jgi:hypothetical protein